MAITKDQIFTTADTIAATGQQPTLAKVRAALGGGSFTTISEAMSEWKAAHAAPAVQLREPAPQAVADRLAELGAEIWQTAVEIANARLATERDALDVVRTEMDATTREAAELADQVSTDLEAAQARCNELQERLDAAETEVGATRLALAASEERAHTADARTVEIERRVADLKEGLARTESQAERNAQELDAARKLAGDAREEAAMLRGKLEAMQVQAAQAAKPAAKAAQAKAGV